MAAFLEGKRIILRPLQKDDLNNLSNLMSDIEIRHLIGEVYPITERAMDEFYEKCQKTNDRIWFVIVDKEKNKIIGETGFLRIFMPWRTSDYSLVLWDKNFWNKGYGKETAALMLDYGFNELNLHRISIGIVGCNERGLKFWRSVGFREEGKQIDGYFCDGQYSNFIMMYLLENYYKQMVK